MKMTGWQVVVTLGMIMATIVVLALSGVDLAAFLGFGTLILAGLGLSAAQGAKDNTNGANTRMLMMLEQLANRLGDAPSLPPAKDTVDSYRG